MAGSLVHPLSNQSVHEALNLFSIPCTQTSIQEGKYVEIFPLANLGQNAPLEFFIPSSDQMYVDMNDSYLHVKVRVVKSTGADLDGGMEVALTNNFLSSMFSQVDVTLGDKLISPSENTYPYRAFFSTLFSDSREALDLTGDLTMFKRDTPGKFNVVTGGENVGFKARRDAIAGSKSVDLFGRLHTEISETGRFLPPSIPIKIKLT